MHIQTYYRYCLLYIYTLYDIHAYYEIGNTHIFGDIRRIYIYVIYIQCIWHAHTHIQIIPWVASGQWSHSSPRKLQDEPIGDLLRLLSHVSAMILQVFIYILLLILYFDTTFIKYFTILYIYDIYRYRSLHLLLYIYISLFGVPQPPFFRAAEKILRPCLAARRKSWQWPRR